MAPDTLTTLTPLSEDEFGRYADKWVALRNGKVIAAADSYDELQEDDEVRDDDATYYVPSSNSLFY